MHAAILSFAALHHNVIHPVGRHAKRLPTSSPSPEGARGSGGEDKQGEGVGREAGYWQVGSPSFVAGATGVVPMKIAQRLLGRSVLVIVAVQPSPVRVMVGIVLPEVTP